MAPDQSFLFDPDREQLTEKREQPAEEEADDASE